MRLLLSAKNINIALSTSGREPPRRHRVRENVVIQQLKEILLPRAVRLRRPEHPPLSAPLKRIQLRRDEPARVLPRPGAPARNLAPRLRAAPARRRTGAAAVVPRSGRVAWQTHSQRRGPSLGGKGGGAYRSSAARSRSWRRSTHRRTSTCPRLRTNPSRGTPAVRARWGSSQVGARRRRGSSDDLHSL